MKHIKLFENFQDSSWNESFRTLAKLAKPITKNQFIRWNDDTSLPEEGWEALIQFFIKGDVIDNKDRIAKELGEERSQDVVDLLNLGLINWDDMLDILDVNIMLLEGETFPMDVIMNNQIMDFYNYDIWNAPNEGKQIYADLENGLEIFATTINNVKLCQIRIDSYSVICFSSNF